MKQISIDKMTLIIWLTALLFLSLIPISKNDCFQDNQSEFSSVSVTIQQNGTESYFDLEETEDASKHHFIKFNSFQNCYFREIELVKWPNKISANNKNQIDITFFSLPPPVQNG